MSEIWPGGDHQYSNNLGLSLWGADPVVIENFLTIDAAFGSISSAIDINGIAVPNPNFVDSASVTFMVVGSNVHATAASGVFAQTKTAIASNWLNSYSATTGLFTAAQPASTDLSDYGTIPNAALAHSTVGLTDSTGLFTITGSPVSLGGSLTFSAFASQAQGTFLGGPASGSGAATFRTLTAADIPASAVPYINVVTVFGADNTGATDSTAAIQAALTSLDSFHNSGVGIRTLFFPAGTYNISKQLVFEGNTSVGIRLLGEAAVGYGFGGAIWNWVGDPRDTMFLLLGANCSEIEQIEFSSVYTNGSSYLNGIWVDSTNTIAANITYNISSITRVGNLVTATIGSHAIVSPFLVKVAGVTNTSFNGTFRAIYVDATTVSWINSGSDASSSGGTCTLYKSSPSNDTTFRNCGFTGAASISSTVVSFSGSWPTYHVVTATPHMIQVGDQCIYRQGGSGNHGTNGTYWGYYQCSSVESSTQATFTYGSYSLAGQPWTITHLSEDSSNVVTASVVTVNSGLIVGSTYVISGLSHYTWLNGQTITVLSSGYLWYSTLKFNDPTSQGMQAGVDDSGTLTAISTGGVMQSDSTGCRISHMYYLTMEAADINTYDCTFYGRGDGSSMCGFKADQNGNVKDFMNYNLVASGWNLGVVGFSSGSFSVFGYEGGNSGAFQYGRLFAADFYGCGANGAGAYVNGFETESSWNVFWSGGAVHLDSGSCQGSCPDNDVLITSEYLVITNCQFGNMRTATSVPRISSNPFGNIVGASSIISIENVYSNTAYGAAGDMAIGYIPVIDGSGNIFMQTGGGYTDAQKWNITSINDRGTQTNNFGDVYYALNSVTTYANLQLADNQVAAYGMPSAGFLRCAANATGYFRGNSAQNRAFFSLSAADVLVLGDTPGVEITGPLLIGGTDTSISHVSPNVLQIGITTGTSDASGTLKLGATVMTAAAPTVSASQVGFGGTVAATANTTGGGLTLPLLAAGYLIINVAGTQFKVPYYAN